MLSTIFAMWGKLACFRERVDLKEDIAAAKSDTQEHGNFIFIIDAVLLFDSVLNCTSNNLTRVLFDYECTEENSSIVETI